MGKDIDKWMAKQAINRLRWGIIGGLSDLNTRSVSFNYKYYYDKEILINLPSFCKCIMEDTTIPR